MDKAFKALKISDRVYWVGAVDWGLRNFHGYRTAEGTTYNAFLIVADKVTLIDTVKAPFVDEMMTRIASVIDPKKIDYIVSNHAEMDHSGALPRVIAAVAPQKIFASEPGSQALDAHFHWGEEVTPVKTGERLDLGGATLRFVETRMLHWPDSMFAYLEEEGVLFSNDAFGMHLATQERFADEVEETLLFYEAAKYFANILMPYAPLVTNLIGKLPTLDLHVRVIAPDHGPIWRKKPTDIIELYGKWAAQTPTDKAVLVYDTMWQSTATMARAVAEGLTAGGAAVKIMPLAGSHRSDVVTELLDAGALVVGSPTMNNNIYPTVIDAMTYVKGLRPQNMVGGVFGSFGWSGEAVRHLSAMMQEMKIETAGEGLAVKYVPDGDALDRCFDLGREVATMMRARIG